MLTQLKYVSDLPLFEVEQPYELFGYPTPESGKITNCEYTVHENINARDVRDSTVEFSLGSTGFVFMKHASQCPLKAEHFEFAGNDSGNKIVTTYLQETIDLVKEHAQAEKVICFDWRFRRSTPQSQALQAPQDVLDVRYQALPPGLTMHCDFSHQGGRDRLEMHLMQEELDMVDKGIFSAQIINAWRPFGLVHNAPLIITDRRSVLLDDLLEVDKVLPDKVEKAYYVKHRDYHHWYWMSDQTPQDLALFKTWSSTCDGTLADFPPHGAAMHFSPSCAEPRESMEVRMIVLTKVG